MKRISFFLLALSLAVGCSSSTSDEDPSQQNESDIKKSGNKLACSDVGGSCVGLTPFNCQGGTWADANAVTCGGGIGVACCVKPQPPPPPPPPPVQTDCEKGGGECVGLTPYNCKDGTWADYSTHSCGPAGFVGMGCCIKDPPPDPCPTLSPPSPTFCTGGTIKPIIDATGCTRGYDCIKPSTNDCEKAGGECMGLTPSNCTDGSWADYTTHSCGSGIGVGCCMH